MSYYKYAERSSESRVDWNEISKGMVDMLKEQTRLRNEKLDDALELQNTITTTLSEAPMGSDENANQRISGFASDAQEYMLMMNKLWRSGEMSYREYMAATNNFQTNANGYLTQAERYNEAYEVHQKRMEELTASAVEESELARVEDFGNFSKFTPVIDAPTGSIGLVGDDGANYASVTQLGVAVMSQYDRLDVEGRTTEVADQMGTTIKVLKRGGVQTLESALQNDDYVAAEDNAVSGILVGDNAHTSVLVDFDMGAYDTTHSVTEALNDPMAILMVPSSRNKDRMIGSVEDDADFEKYLGQLTIDGEALTEEQKTTLRTNRDAQRERSIEAVREQLRARLPFKETAMPTRPRSSGGGSGKSDARRKAEKEAEQGVQALQKLWGATTESDVKSAIGFFEGMTGLELSVVNNPSTNQRSLAVDDGSGQVAFYDIDDSYEDFVTKVGTILTNSTYLDEAMRKNPLDTDKYPQVGTAKGQTFRTRILNPSEIGQETVTVGGVSTTVNDMLEGLKDVPTDWFGRPAPNEAEQMDRASANATRIRRILEDLGVVDDIQVRVEEYGGSKNTPAIIIISNGQERSFSMLEGEFGPIKNYLIEEIASVAAQKGNSGGSRSGGNER